MDAIEDDLEAQNDDDQSANENAITDNSHLNYGQETSDGQSCPKRPKVKIEKNL